MTKDHSTMENLQPQAGAPAKNDLSFLADYLFSKDDSEIIPVYDIHGDSKANSQD